MMNTRITDVNLHIFLFEVEYESVTAKISVLFEHHLFHYETRMFFPRPLQRHNWSTSRYNSRHARRPCYARNKRFTTTWSHTILDYGTECNVQISSEGLNLFFSVAEYVRKDFLKHVFFLWFEIFLLLLVKDDSVKRQTKFCEPFQYARLQTMEDATQQRSTSATFSTYIGAAAGHPNSSTCQRCSQERAQTRILESLTSRPVSMRSTLALEISSNGLWPQDQSSSCHTRLTSHWVGNSTSLKSLTSHTRGKGMWFLLKRERHTEILDNIRTSHTLRTVSPEQ